MPQLDRCHAGSHRSAESIRFAPEPKPRSSAKGLPFALST
jgi:hypothetical protein